MKIQNLWHRAQDSYDHYRTKVGCPPHEAVWRCFAYEILRWPDGLRPRTFDGWRTAYAVGYEAGSASKKEKMDVNFERLWNVADDEEAAVLQRLLVKAGELLKCPECGGYVDPAAMDECDACGVTVQEMRSEA